MSLWRPKERRTHKGLVLGLDAQHLAWLAPDMFGPARATTARHDAVAQAVQGATAGTRVDVVAASDLAVHWLQTPPSSVASFDELQLVAGARCAHLFGGSPRDWCVTGDWSASRSFVCAALPRSVMLALQEKLASLGMSTRWHTAWGLLCKLRSGLFPSEGWCAMRSPRRVALWHCRTGQVNCLTTLAVDEHARWPAVARRALGQLQIEGARDHFLPGPLHWLHLDEGQEAQEVPGIRSIRLALPEISGLSPGEASTALGLGCLLTQGGR